MPKVLPKYEETNLLFYPKKQLQTRYVRLALLRGLATAICQNINIPNQTIHLFRIMLFVYILGEVIISYIFCFIFRDLLTFSKRQNHIRQIAQIFLAFSEQLNFTFRFRTLKKPQQLLYHYSISIYNTLSSKSLVVNGFPLCVFFLYNQ